MYKSWIVFMTILMVYIDLYLYHLMLISCIAFYKALGRLPCAAILPELTDSISDHVHLILLNLNSTSKCIWDLVRVGTRAGSLQQIYEWPQSMLYSTKLTN